MGPRPVPQQGAGRLRRAGQRADDRRVAGDLRRRHRAAARRRPAGGAAAAPPLTAALQFLSQPWSEPVMRRAALECVLLAWSGGLLGCWLVLYRLSYATESLAHGLLPGLVVATLAGGPLLVGGAAGLV